MTDHYQLGKKLILLASEAQYRMMQEAERVLLTTWDGSAHIFEIALRRIHESDLASKFVDPHATVTASGLVLRESTKHSFLSSIIASLERGERSFAESLEAEQRGQFHLAGVGYVDAHFRWAMNPWEEKKEQLRKGILEKGYTGEQCDRNDGRYDEAGWNIGEISLNESLLAVYANLALGNSEFARTLLREIRKTFFNPNTGIYRADRYSEGWHGTTDVCRALGLAGDTVGREVFESKQDDFLQAYDTEEAASTLRLYSGHHAKRDLVALAFAMDHFACERLEEVRERIANLPEVKKGKVQTKAENNSLLRFCLDSYMNENLCIKGLALTGLEKHKLNSFCMI